MNIADNIKDFFKWLTSYLTKNSINNETLLPGPVEDLLNTDIDSITSSVSKEEKEDKVTLAKRTMMTKFYVLKQEIEVFRFDYPDEYQKFLKQIEDMESDYTSSLEKLGKEMTFEIDPELDGIKMAQINRIEKSIKKFIETEVRFSILSKKLQTLIVKLNILYNVSIFHHKDEEKRKALSQIERALTSGKDIAKELKENDYILHDNQLKERLVMLISYLDYEIFKISLRCSNSDNTPESILKGLTLAVEFKDFDYINAFKAFVEDELSNLKEFIPKICEDVYRNLFQNRIEKLIKSFAMTQDITKQVLDREFWNSIFDLESSMFSILESTGVDKETIKVRLIDRMMIKVLDSEVLTLPKTNAYLSLINIFSSTQDERVLVLIKLFKNLSNEVTYREIYFLVLLFDAMQVVENTPNSLRRYMQKYKEKYPYSQRDIEQKKEFVLNQESKEYLIGFELDDSKERVSSILDKINIDFIVSDGIVYINSFYFNGLDNVIHSLQTIKTKNND